MTILSKGNETKVLIGVGLIGVYTAYKIMGAKQSIKETVTKDLNPASDDNIVNKAVSSVVDRFTGGKHKSLGSALYCLFNSDEIVCNPEMAATARALDVGYYNEDGTVNQQLYQLYMQEQEFYEEDTL